MNTRNLFLSFFLLCVGISSAQTTFEVEVKNPIAQNRTDVPVVIPIDDSQSYTMAKVTIDGVEIPSQLDDLNRDGHNDELCFVTDLKKKEKKVFQVVLNSHDDPCYYQPRTFAELMLRNPKVKVKNQQDIYLQEISVTPDTQDPYHLVHHHGIAFESELIAIRVYFDKRQTLDLYGKFQKRLELKETQFYTLDEQKAQGYGDDVLWVGNTFGLGAFRGWDGTQPTMIDDVLVRAQRIIATGPVRTIVEVEDRGWRYQADEPRLNMTIRYTLYAGHRDVDVDVLFNKDMTGKLFSTGLINVKDSKEFSDKDGLRGLWGTDFPAGAKDSIAHPRETVGMGIYIPKQIRVSEEPANKDNYAFVVKPAGNHLHYNLVYGSANETFGYHNDKEWFQFLKEWRKELEAPVVVGKLFEGEKE